MTDYKIDLHIHSCCSDDGDLRPAEIIDLAKQNQIKVIAIADHNTTKAVHEAVSCGNDSGVKVIPAIEIDCSYKDVNLHVLGYYIDPDHEGFSSLEEHILVQERETAAQRIEKIKALGIYVNMDTIKKITKDGVVTGEMIAEASLYEPENIGNALLKPYLEGGARNDNPFVNFYWDFCAQGKPAYIPIHFPSLSDVIQLIHGSGGTAILAHPGNNIHENDELLKGIIHEGIQGLEVYSSYHTQEQVDFYNTKAKEYNMITTYGSDFHGKTKPGIQLVGFYSQGLYNGLKTD